MSALEKQKAKKRKNRKGAKSSSNSATILPAESSPATTTSEELAIIQRLMDAEQDCGPAPPAPPPPPFPRGPNPYLGGERCLLCRCERPDPPAHKQDGRAAEEDEGQEKTGGCALSQLPLWVCPECRKTVEEEEKKAVAYDSAGLLEQELRLEAPALALLPDLTSDPVAFNNSMCSCKACIEQRQMDAEYEKETQELQQFWMELRHVVRCLYREAGTGLTESEREHESTPHDIQKLKNIVHRLCMRDPHQLYQRLESQGREYVIEMKVRLLKQLTSGHKTPAQAKQFVSLLLTEYSNLCQAAKILASFLGELETEHLKRFNLTWELHNKHLFQSIIYSDPFVQNSLPMLIAQLRSGAASKESFHEDTYPNILHRYLKFDDEMSVISVVWRDCQQLVDAYNDEQAALRAKQKMLKDDWEIFRAQRRLLEQQQMLKKTPTSTSTQSFEAQFTETMRNILQGSKPTVEECHCPNCNRKRCPCEECNMPQGVLDPLLMDQQQQQLQQQQEQQQQHQQLHQIQHNGELQQQQQQSHHQTNYEQSQQMQFSQQELKESNQRCPSTSPVDGQEQLYSGVQVASGTACNAVSSYSGQPSPAYLIDVTPPSMSSTNSSSGSSSPINVDPKRLVLPFDVCPESFELTEDEIPEEIEEDDGSVSESDDEDEDDEDEDEDEDELEEEEGDEKPVQDNNEHPEQRPAPAGYGQVVSAVEEGAELASVMDAGLATSASCTNSVSYRNLTLAFPTSSVPPLLGMPMITADAMKTDCDCTHCTTARMEQQKPVEEVLNQCQCHACLLQSGKTVPTCLPQHVPAAPRPAALHLYPHIHGSNSLQTAASLHSHAPHVRPMLQSHLYELHPSPVANMAAAAVAAAVGRPPKTLFSTPKKHGANFSLDLDSHEALHEHIYHAYGEWDNAYDSPKLMFSSHKYPNSGLGSELFSSPPPPPPPPPLPLINGSNFVSADQLTTEAALSVAAASSSGAVTSLSTSATSSAAAAAAAAAAASIRTSSMFQHNTLAQSSPLTSMAASTAFTNTTVASTNGEHVHTEACFKNMKPRTRALFNAVQPLAGLAAKSPVVSSCTALSASAVSSTTPAAAAVAAVSTVSTTNPAVLTSGAAAATSHSDHCLKHNPFLHTLHSSFTSTHATTTMSASPPLPSHPLPVKLRPDLIRSATSVSASKDEGVQSQANGGASVTTLSGPPPPPPPPLLGLPHTCSHQHNPAASLPQMVAHSGASAAAAATHVDSAAAAAVAASSQPTFVNPNAPSGITPISGLPSLNHITVSLPTPGVCHDPDCDGHHDAEYDDSIDDSCSEQSSSTSTSNQKDGGKYCDCCYCEFFGHSNPPQAPTSRNYAEIRDRLRLRLKKKTESTATTQAVDKTRGEQKTEEPRQPPPPPPKDDVLDDRGLEELVRFINGEDKDNKSASTKAAKRARQKMKKAEEKARREAEARAAEERERLLREEEEQQKAIAAAAAAAKEESYKKKKAKHKESSKENEENRNPHVREKGQSDLSQKLQSTKNVTTNNSTTSGSQKANKGKSEGKRGEADGLPVSNSRPLSTPTSRGMSVNSSGGGDTAHLKGRSTGKAPSSLNSHQINNAQSAVTKPESVMNAQSLRLEKSRKGRNSSLLVTCTASNVNSSYPSLKHSVAQSQSHGSNAQQQNRVGKSSVHHHHQQQNSHQDVQQYTSQLVQHNQHSHGIPSTSNKSNSNSSKKSTANSATVANLTNHHVRLDHHHENGNDCHSSPGLTHSQQLNNITTKKGRKSTSVNGTQPPPGTCTSGQQRRQQVTLAGQGRADDQYHGTSNVGAGVHNSRISDRHAHGDGGPSPMMNGGPTTYLAESEGQGLGDRKSGKQAPPPVVQQAAKVKLDERLSKSAEQASGGKQKKNKRKNKSAEDLDEIFMPKDLDPDNAEIDELDREIEEFKRFCLDSTPMPKREKLQVNMNLKDIFSKKKVSCA